MIKLTREQTEQVVQHPDGVECQGEGTDKVFVIVDAQVLRQMQETLYRKDVRESITTGLDDMEAGRVMTAEEADDRIRSELGFAARNQS